MGPVANWGREFPVCAKQMSARDDLSAVFRELADSFLAISHPDEEEQFLFDWRAAMKAVDFSAALEPCGDCPECLADADEAERQRAAWAERDRVIVWADADEAIRRHEFAMRKLRARRDANLAEYFRQHPIL